MPVLSRILLIFICLLTIFTFPCEGKQKMSKKTTTTQVKILKQRLSKMEALADLLQKRINELEKRVEELSKQKESLSTITSTETKSNSPLAQSQDTQENSTQQPSPSQATSTPTTGSEKQIPDISVVVNASTHITSDKTNPDRNKVLVNESEITMQGYLHPNIRGDAFYSFGRAEGENELKGELEEAYATFMETPIKGLGVKAGKMRVDIGKTNKLHSHQLPYEDRAAVIKNFLGSDGLKGHGIEVSYLFPTSRDIFAQLQVGWWRPDAPELNPATNLELNSAGTRIANTLVNSRLWLSKELGSDTELELGLSSAWGRSLFNGAGDNRYDPIQIYGADITLRKFPSANEKLALSLEWLTHRRLMSNDAVSRSGYYVLGTYQPNKYWEWGIRYDNASVPAPSIGHEYAVSAFLTNNLSESTFLRYQLKHGKHLEGESFNEFMVQFVWGVGPHSHALK